MIELDNSGFINTVLDKCQAKWIGNANGLIWFVDTLTKSTHVLDPKDFSLETVRLKLSESRKAFNVKTEALYDQTPGPS